MLVLNPYPQTPFPGKGAILLGLPPLDPVGGYAPATPFLNNQEVYRQSVQPERAVLFYPSQSELYLSTSDGTYRKNVTASCTEYLFYINYKAL